MNAKDLTSKDIARLIAARGDLTADDLAELDALAARRWEESKARAESECSPGFWGYVGWVVVFLSIVAYFYMADKAESARLVAVWAVAIVPLRTANSRSAERVDTQLCRPAGCSGDCVDGVSPGDCTCSHALLPRSPRPRVPHAPVQMEGPYRGGLLARLWAWLTAPECDLNR